ncbi:efflux RND transporter periplasmic adaptor subunit [Azospira inquinata]|uniref:Efflux RND transporter periplasmic adaptor subunit n=1 Tax=Azospira inquinata TaxID=2785627 RepID=A0A975SN98_9RHOO|nr:efflux RND transporter periplasmic adaptor subunit [Azospira inquinata]QWT45190.1 efflux RND transporter periplasmic adaptor subunit [Azospira inquinata]QWT49477.1 efflux RND transporter periplasmic adaptor subunit [Azospira inquinata]
MFRHPQRKNAPYPALAAAALVAALTLGCSKAPDGQGQAMPPLPVSVLSVQPTQVPNAIEIMAQTEGAKETEVRPRVGGILMKRLYEEGAPIKAGQPMYQIDRAPYEIALANAKASADQTAREEARLKGLIAQQAVSQKEYDDAVSANEMAQANLRNARLNLSWTTVVAPVSGVSGRSNKSEGNLLTISDAQALTSIYQTNPIWVRFGLSDSDMAKLPQGHITPKNVTGVELVLPDGTVYDKKGKLNFTASNIDTALGTQQLRAEFPNGDNRLLPGQYVKVRLITGMRDGAFLVPQGAVIQSDQGSVVMVADAQNKVAPRPVQTGNWLGQNWVILGGLKAGDRVIIDNLMKLKPGATVVPHPPQAAGAPGAAPGAQAAPAKQPKA